MARTVVWSECMQMTDGPFFLQEHDESTRVKAMAHSLKTPDSGLGPGLYEPAPASLSRHAPQVVIGIPRDCRLMTTPPAC